MDLWIDRGIGRCMIKQVDKNVSGRMMESDILVLKFISSLLFV